MDLRDRVVLVTGGKRVGASVATELARRGADVSLSYNRSRADVEETAAAVRVAGRRALVVQADLAHAAECEALVATTVGQLGRLDVLVNLASVYRSVPFAEMTADDLRASLDVDLAAATDDKAIGNPVVERGDCRDREGNAGDGHGIKARRVRTRRDRTSRRRKLRRSKCSIRAAATAGKSLVYNERKKRRTSPVDNLVRK